MTTLTPNRITDLETARLKLAQVRDELKLKMHLAKADARDEWRGLEKKWQKLEDRLKTVHEATEKSAQVVWDDVRDLSDDLRRGYERIRKSL